MDKEKTAMQQLRAEVISMRNEAHVNCLDEYKNACNHVINRIDKLLELEKKQIVEAYDEAKRDMMRAQRRTLANSIMPKLITPPNSINHNEQ